MGRDRASWLAYAVSPGCLSIYNYDNINNQFQIHDTDIANMKEFLGLTAKGFGTRVVLLHSQGNQQGQEGTQDQLQNRVGVRRRRPSGKNN